MSDFPLKQGQLDFLCGVYAAINAMQFRREIETRDQAAIPFRLGVMFMQSTIDWDLAKAICLGVDGLCCTNPFRDSSRESSVIGSGHEQTKHTDLQDAELARV